MSRTKTMKAILSILSFIMLSKIVHSFSVQSSKVAERTIVGALSTRWMSTPAGADTSIVETCRQKIAAALETEDVKVTGAYDDPNGSHISVEVISLLFEGKRPVQRQQLVYKALWEELQGPVHAVDSMICKTPSEK
ncbi:hypothetical protein HJC23_003956 [Cyclotella cryptica]|uniref:BolA-like protein n=1 Tax=Cyclotella cryptica TaxID=29204 RepID=A0ABD3PVQ6_9STRA|eukprot:CCRYP_011487-RA/>CCRYP_011487-RA protein AED:0.04 eAED:0.04 QI:27/1/1/1/0.33/0.25/4/1960/135